MNVLGGGDIRRLPPIYQDLWNTIHVPESSDVELREPLAWQRAGLKS